MFAYHEVYHIREFFINDLHSENFVLDKSGCKMLELRSASFIANERAIFGTPNDDYINREISWYTSQSLNINDIPGGPPKIWQQVATPQGQIISNYGWCIFSNENHNQYQRVLAELIANPNSRRAIMIYTRPSMWNEYNKDGMSDFMCTNNVQYMIRNGKLETHVYMRSNDVVFGYKNDYAWQNYVRLMLAHELNVEPGLIFWNVGSLHVYERHFHLVNHDR